jgi:hypothetical protein
MAWMQPRRVQGGTEFLQEAGKYIGHLDKSVSAWELQRLLSGPFDEGPAILSIYAGAGGEDAMDWAEMLERMYLRWFQVRGWQIKEIDRVTGEGAGLKSVDYEVRGRFAFGVLYAEKGTHRLVRQSPFNSKSARQTSFAAVDVAPVVDDVRRQTFLALLPHVTAVTAFTAVVVFTAVTAVTGVLQCSIVLYFSALPLLPLGYCDVAGQFTLCVIWISCMGSGCADVCLSYLTRLEYAECRGGLAGQ